MGERWLVCGGREFKDRKRLYDTLTQLVISRHGMPDVVIHGGAAGADTLAADWALHVARVPAKVFKANWRGDGNAAGPIRNQRMLDEGRPDLVVAFPGGSGTADMKRRAEAAGIKVIEVDYGPH